MKFKNNPLLFQHLIDGGLIHLAAQLQFDLDEDAFLRLLSELQTQHPELNPDEAQARAAYRLLATPAAIKALEKKESTKWKLLKKLMPNILMITWRVLILLLLGAIAAKAQTPATIRQDCVLQFEFTAASRSASFDNRNLACTSWHLTYYSTGFSAVSIQFDFANDSAGAPGSWSVWPVLASGTTLPLTATTSDEATGYRYKPWVSVNLNSVTGSGTVRGILIGQKPGSQQDSSGTGGGSSVTISGTPNFNLAQIGGVANSAPGVSVVDAANSSFRITCANNCPQDLIWPETGGSFFLGNRYAVPFAGVVDETATNTVAENDVGVPRMNTNRILYSNLRNNAGVETGVAALPLQVSLANTGTNSTNVNFNFAALGGTAVSGANIVDAGNTAFRVNCVVGCSGSSFADSSAFTFTTTPISLTGFVVDDTATNTVAENSAAAARMNTNRILYADLSLTAANATALKVDGSAVTQPISAASLPLPTGASTAAKQPALGTAGSASTDVITIQGIAAMTKLLVTPDSVALPANQSVNVDQWGDTALGTPTNFGTTPGAVIAGSTNSSLFLGTTAARSNQTTTATGALDVNIVGSLGATNSATNGTFMRLTDNTTAVGVIAGTTALKTDLSSVAGTATSTAAAGVMKVGVVGNANAAFDAASAAAPPANRIAIGGLTSGATAGLMVSPTYCDSFANVNIVTATTTLIITGVSGRHVRICAISLVTAGANNVAFISGTGATCGTGTTGMTGGTTAATGYNFAANGGLTQGNGIGEINRTNAVTDSVCIITSAAVQLSGRISYAIY